MVWVSAFPCEVHVKSKAVPCHPEIEGTWTGLDPCLRLPWFGLALDATIALVIVNKCGFSVFFGGGAFRLWK